MNALDAGGRTIAGVDGCKAGWIAVILRPGNKPAAGIFPTFAGLIDSLPADAIVAVDMPIGLPDFISPAGRGPEKAVRALLRKRRPSVFSIPSRAAVYSGSDEFQTNDLRTQAHRHAVAIARATSDPSRGVSIQGFGIFPKIREIDVLLRPRPDLRSRIIESHPEVAFWRLNGEQEMLLPKKAKKGAELSGADERRKLLGGIGLSTSFLHQAPPRGAAADDFLDASALLFIAARHARGEAKPFPDPPGVDSHGIPIAIWA